jgi:hypothetical protein
MLQKAINVNYYSDAILKKMFIIYKNASFQ